VLLLHLYLSLPPYTKLLGGKCLTHYGTEGKGKFLKSEDIRRQFARELRAHQRNELILLLGKKIIENEEKVEGRSSKGRRPVLARYISGGTKLRARYKRKLISARVREDGSIRFDGKIYFSPSLAAAAACKRPTCNGWTFWQYERAPGDWVLLNELRKE